MSSFLLFLVLSHGELLPKTTSHHICNVYTLEVSPVTIAIDDALIDASAQLIHEISTKSQCNIHYNHSITHSESNWKLSLTICTYCDLFDVFQSKFIHKDASRHLLQSNNSANTTVYKEDDNSEDDDDRTTKLVFLIAGSSIMACCGLIGLFMCCKTKKETSDKNISYVIGQPHSVKSQSGQSTINRTHIEAPLASDDYLPDEIEEDDDDDEVSTNDKADIIVDKAHTDDKEEKFLAFNDIDDRIFTHYMNEDKSAQKPYTNQVQYAMVKSWLEETVQLPQYYPMFILNGFESMKLIYTIEGKQTLKHIGIDLLGHRTKIMADIARGKKDPVAHFNEIQNHWLRKEQLKARNAAKNNGDIALEIEPQQKQKKMKQEKKIRRKETEEKQIEIAIEKSKNEQKLADESGADLHEIHEIECGVDDVGKCESVQRVIKIMKLFEDWNFEQNNYGLLKYEAFSAQFASYNVMNVINDYHHYLDEHYTLFNILYVLDSILKGMSHGECDRDHVLAEEDHQRVIEDEKIKISTDDAVKLQILCAMHSDMMHYDVPQIDENDERDIDIFEEEEELELAPRIKFDLAPRSSNKKAHKMNKHKRECSKFFTEIVNLNKNIYSVKQIQYGTPQHDELDEFAYDDYDSESSADENNENNEEINEQLPSYGFGRRWFYWKHYIKHRDFIAAKYGDLKSELLTNSIYHIEDILDWNSVANKAAVYIKCIRARSLRASGELEYFYWRHTKQEEIHLEHIIALLFYCNYDKLQANFSESFRIIASDTNRWSSVKKRNEEYANWSRLLREAVELYGDPMRRYRDIKLYHGLNCELVFSSINCKFCAPTSMTTSRAVAESFSRGFGLILTLTMYDSNLRFFDCSWLSNYPSEEEKLFIGGAAFIKLSSIILSRLGHNYKHYICAIGIIQNMFDARHNPEKNQLNKQTTAAVNVLLKKHCEKSSSIPAYIEQLFSYFTKNWDKTIRIDIEKLYCEYKIFHELIIDKEADCVKIDAICKIFDNINCIQIVNGFKFTQYSFNKLHLLLSRNENNVFKNLNEIKIEISGAKNNPKYARNVEKIVQKRKNQFAKINWNVAYAASNNYADRHTHTEYVIFVKDVPLDTRR